MDDAKLVWVVEDKILIIEVTEGFMTLDKLRRIADQIASSLDNNNPMSDDYYQVVSFKTVRRW